MFAVGVPIVFCFIKDNIVGFIRTSFIMDDAKTLISKVFSKKKVEIRTLSELMDKVVIVNVKSVEVSETSRKCGNDLFLQKNHDDQVHQQIFAHYCKSIITAPNGSQQLCFALANRSSFLLHIEKYQDCIHDIDRALTIIGSNILLKVKLLCRKAECLKKLGLLMYLDILKEAESSMDKIDFKCKDDCNKLIDKVKKLPTHSKPIAMNEIDYLPETKDILIHITIDYDADNYGRYLVAARDYVPGDVIFVEKLYATDVAPNKSSILCNYCLKYAWSGIPCDQCDWAIFCSEECKLKAWKEFHDIECTLIPHLKLLDILFPYYDMSLRLLILGIKEAGSIIKLKEVIIDSDDVIFKGPGMFSSKTIQSVYSLNCDGLSDSEHETIALSVVLILIGIIKYSNLIDNFVFQDIEDLMKNEDVLFIGLLLIKLIAIKSINCFSLSDNRNKVCDKSSSPEECIINSCCARGCGLSIIASLINHSCFPNASSCTTEDLKTVVYAVQPIKKGSQIFISYSVLFYFYSLIERQTRLQKYKFNCNCEACNHCWPPLLAMTKDQLAQQNYSIKNDIERKIYLDCRNIFEALDSKSVSFEKNHIDKLSKSIMKVRDLKQPSLLTSLLMEALNIIFPSIYGMRSPSFGKCQA